MKLEKLKSFEDYISPMIRVIIKNKTEIIINKIYPKDISFKSILISENLPYDIDYTFQKKKINKDKSIIEFLSQNSDDQITDLELVIESEDILDISENQNNKIIKENNYYKILCPYEKPFRILSYNSQENNISLKKYDKDILMYFELNNFSLSNSSYCNTYNDLFLSNGENNFLYKINNIDTNIEKLDIIPWKKKFHSMIYIPNKYIYFIGGNNRSTFHYDFINKTFKLWAPLKYKEKYPSLIYLNKTFIYCFGHQKKIDDLNFIERTNIKMRPKWDVINLKLNEPFNLKKFGTVLSNDEKIFFVGGKKAKDDRIFYFDLLNNEISKTTQINTAMKIGETNFYKINEYTDILIPQETKGDIKFIAFNQRTKKFRKLRYEKDFDLINENKLLELDENNFNSIEENIKLTAGINLKKIENKFENENTPQKEGKSEDDFQMPSLLEIKKLLLGDKNILNKNVEAMIFNRQRIKTKKNDKIDGDESEEEYINNLNEDDNILFNDEKSENVSDDENEQNNIKINLRSIPNKREKNNNNNIKNINIVNNNSCLRNMFNKDVDDDIDVLRVQNPRITIDDYKNLMFFNKISSSYINQKLINNSEIKSSENPFLFKDDKDNKLRFNLTGKNKKINDKIPNQNLQNKENIINNIDETNEKNKDHINKNNNINTKESIEKKISIGENYIDDSSRDSNESEKNKKFNPLSNNKDYIMNATIKGKMTNIIGEKNFGILKANDTYNSLTLKELFQGDINDKIILNSGTVVVPGSDKNEINIKPKNGKIEESINNSNKDNIKPSIDINKNKIEINKPDIIEPINKNELKTNSDLGQDIISIYTELKPALTLKEEFGKNIDENIYIKQIKTKLSIDEISIPNNKDNDNSIKISDNIEINGPNINLSNIKLQAKKPEIEINGNLPDLNNKKNNINIPGIEIDLGGSKDKNELNPLLTLKQIMNEDINSPYNLIINKLPLEPNLNGSNLSYSYIGNKIPQLVNIPQQNIETKTPLPIYESIKGEIPGKNINKPSFEVYTGEIPGTAVKEKKNGISFKKPELNTDSKIKESNANIDMKLKGSKINIEKPNINVDIDGKINIDKNDINYITLKEIFSGDINDEINLNIINPILWKNDNIIISDSNNDNNINGIKINLPSSNLELNPPDLSTPTPGMNAHQYILKASVPNDKELNGKIAGSMPGINFNKPNINLKLDKNLNVSAITLKDLFGKDIEDEIDLNIIKQELWGNNVDDGLISSGLINGKINLNLPSANINIVQPNINMSNINQNINLDPNFNKPNLDFNPGLDANALNIDGNVKLKGPNTNINLTKPKFDLDIKGPQIDLNANGKGIDINKNLSLTLKDIFNQDVNDDMILNVINPKLWKNEKKHLSKSLKFPKRNVDMNDPNIDKIVNYSLRASYNIPDFDTDIKIENEIPDINLNIPNANIGMVKPQINTNIKKPNIDVNLKGIKFDINEKRERSDNNIDSITLKELFNCDIDDKIILNIKNPKLWGNNINENNFSLSGIINGNLDLKIPKGNININRPDINISNNPINDINIPDFNMKGKIEGIKMNEPQIETNIKIPELNTNIKKPEFNINLINANKDEKNCITLKQIFNGDIDDNINLNVIKQELWGTDNFNISGLINGINKNLELKLPSGNLDINGPKLNKPNLNLNADINKPKIETNLNTNELDFNIPSLEINRPNLNGNLNIQKPDINVKLNKPKLNKDKKEFSSLTLKQLCQEDINENIYLNIINPTLWGNNEDFISNNNFNLPSVNINISKPEFNLPNVDINGKIPDIKIDTSKPNVDSNININENIPGFNMNMPKPIIDSSIKISGDISGLNITNSKINNEFNPVITLKEEFGKDINDNIINLNPKKHILTPNTEIIDPSLKDKIEIEIPDININLPNFNLKGQKPNIPGINISKPNINNTDSININLNKNPKQKNISRNPKKFIEESISGEIPGINTNKSRTEIIQGQIPGIKIKKEDESSNTDIIKPDFNMNINGGVDINKPKVGIDINGPNIKEDKYMPEFNDYDIDEIELELTTLKDLFNGDVNDKIDFDYDLNKKNQKLWGNENINDDLNKFKIDTELKLPKAQANINTGKLDIFVPEVNLSEIDSEMKMSDSNFNVNKPKFNTDIKGMIPNLKINNKINIKKDKDNSDMEFDLNNKEINLLSNNEKINSQIIKSNGNDEAPISDIRSNLMIEIEKPEINMTNIKLKGDVNGKNNLDINSESNNMNLDIDIPKLSSNIDMNNFDINNNAKIDLNMKLPKKTKISNYCVTLKELFDQDVNDKIDELNIINQDFSRRNNTLYISGENDKINYFPTDDISIKGPNIKSPVINANINQDLKNQKINLENKSEISVPSLPINKNKSSESETVNNINNNYEIKINLTKEEINSIPKGINSHITLKELFSKDINDDIKLIILKKKGFDIDSDINGIDISDYERSNCDENIEGNIIPTNIDIKYKSITNSNDINNISPSKIKTNNKIIKQEEAQEEKKEENPFEDDDDFILPGEEDIKSLNMNVKMYNDNKINNNMKNENKDEAKENKEKIEKKENKEINGDGDLDFDLGDYDDLI